MSGLYDRLRAISSRQEPPKVVAPSAACRVVEHWFDVPPFALCDEMRLLGGCGEHPVFIDTETTGLMGSAGTIAVLVGVGKYERGRFRVTQYYLSDYDQEDDMIGKIEQELRGADLIVTYNGKSFDIPLLRSRFVMTRRPPSALEMPHIDLLHGARRVYKRRLYSCTLTDIESQVLGIERESDLPGKLVPEYWFRYVKEGDQSLMDEILRHNEQDIVSLALLLAKLCEAYRAPEAHRHRQDVLSVGRAMERMGEGDRASLFYVAAGGGEALTALGRIYRRNGQYDDALEVFAQAAMENGSLEAMVEIAKIEEHKKQNLPNAIQWTDTALAAAQSAEWTKALIYRRKRLKRKMGATE